MRLLSPSFVAIGKSAKVIKIECRHSLHGKMNGSRRWTTFVLMAPMSTGCRTDLVYLAAA